MKFILFILISLFVRNLHADTLKLVTGDYAPYTGEKLLDGGVSTKIVKAAFNEIKINVSVEFIPWNRAMNNLKAGITDGSFPWIKNEEREIDLLYSEPINKYNQSSFVKKGSSLLAHYDLKGKKLCQPSGWDISFLKSIADSEKIILERPINMDSCMHMLALGRVDVIVMNHNVGIELNKALYPKDSPLVEINNDYFGKDFFLYFVVPKKNPNAKKILADFNRGLALIKSNGKYETIVHELIKKQTLKANDGVYNQLGSL